MKGLVQDVRFGARLLVRSPAFTSVAVLVLALGIGVNTAVFTLVNALLLEPLNGGRSGRLIGVYNRDVRRPDSYRAFSYGDYTDLRDRSGVFAKLAALDFTMVGVSEQPGVVRHAFVGLVSSNYFDTLGVAPSRGRQFTPEEERPGQLAHVVVVSYEYWRKTGFDEGLLGRTVAVNGRPFTVVGIAPEGFTGTLALLAPEMWLPLSVHDLLGNVFDDGKPSFGLADRRTHRLMLAGRIADGIGEAAAATRLASFGRQLAQAYPAENRDQTVIVHPLSRLGASTAPSDENEVTKVSSLLLGMAGIVLFIACLNLANMMLARGAARRKEIAIRLAVGGGRMRIVRQLLTEGLLLSLLGGAAGMVMAVWATRAFMLTLVPLIPMSVSFDPTPDGRVLAATLAFAVLATVTSSLGPAWSLTRPDVLPDLKEQPRAAAVRRGWRMLVAPRHAMVIGQLALSLMLLTAGGLFLRGALAAAAADPGFPLAGGLVVSLDPAAGGFDEVRGRAAYQAVLSRVRSLPGVQAASLASLVSFGDISEGRNVESPGRKGPSRFAYLTTVGSDYFASLGLPILRGRGFTASEESDPHAPAVAVVDELLARTLWPGQAPIGQQVRFTTDEGAAPERPFEVVGVVPSTRHELFDQNPQAHLYLPAGSHYRAPMNLHVRLTPGAPDSEQAMLGTLRRELRAVDPQLPIMSAKTLTEHRDASIALWLVRAGAGLFSTFGVLAVLLAAVGLYGVKAYLVSRRTREIGIRMALGARSGDVMRMILGEGLQVTAVGLGFGLVLSAGVAMALGKLLYRVNPLDPTTFVAASLVLLMAAVAACWLPARKATRIVTVKALRSE